VVAVRALRATLAALAVAVAIPAAAVADPVPAGPPAQPAPPAPSFELRDRGNAVEVIAHNIKAARTAIMPVRSRLEVPLVGLPTAKRVAPGDATVKLIELDGGGAVRVLSVKLGFDRDDVKALSRFAQAIQVGDDLHLLVPRKLPSDGLAPRLPGPTLPPALAAAVAQIDQLAEQPATQRPAGPPAPATPNPATRPESRPSSATAAVEATPNVEPEAKIEAKIDARPDAKIDARPDAKIDARPDARPDAKIDAKIDAKPDATAVAHGAETTKPVTGSSDPRPLKQALAPESEDTWSKISMYGALGLAAAGAGVWWMRRRRGTVAPSASIEVIAQRSLGGKARILWLTAGPRELIVSVTAQHVRLLGQWPRADATSQTNAFPAAQTFADARGDFRHEPTDSKPVSPAVSGILRLRARTGQMPVSDVVATGDLEADELWAREIRAATGPRS
jgi:flagellar biogenesis protein FliO